VLASFDQVTKIARVRALEFLRFDLLAVDQVADLEFHATSLVAICQALSELRQYVLDEHAIGQGTRDHVRVAMPC
jgi:hypothetical protein